VSASEDKTVKIWNLTTGECVFTLADHLERAVTILQLNDERLATGSDDCVVKIWDVIIGKCLLTLR
jgi:WD40 repeat protein